MPTAVAAQILQAALRPDCVPGELAQLACVDPGFALRTLQFVNSPMYQRSRSISDVHQAASMLGVRGLRSLALGLLVSGMVPQAPEARPLLANALRRALAARRLASEADPKLADMAFTTGLFLEAGLLAKANDNLASVAHVATGPADARLVLERSEGLAPHPRSGADLAQQYGLPTEIGDAIAHHHDDACPTDALGAIAWTAERTAAIFEGGNLDEAQTLARHGLSGLGLAGDRLDVLVEELPNLVTETARVFERDVGDQPSFDSLLMNANRRLAEMNLHYEVALKKLETLLEEKEQLAQQLRSANEDLERLATTDALTGLANRHALNRHLDRALERADQTALPLSIVVIDLDDFKRLNDTYGHDVGDEVLQYVSALLQRTVRRQDLVARFGGEEIVVLLPDTDPTDATALAARMRSALAERPVPTSAGPVPVTMSAGVAAALGPGCAGDAKPLFAAADKALYAAKRAGKDRVMVGALGA